jgi:hypothetical protein
MSKVYVVQEVYGRDFMPAKKFGELVPLLQADTQIYLSATPAVRRLTRHLSKFTDEDYLLLVGDPVLIGIAVSIACAANRGKVKLLKWDKRNMDYHAVSVDIFQKGEQFNE